MAANTPDIREIDVRQNDGITVTLSGHFNYRNECDFCIVSVETPSENFTLSEIPLNLAVDYYHHPFFYASRELSCGKVAA